MRTEAAIAVGYDVCIAALVLTLVVAAFVAAPAHRANGEESSVLAYARTVIGGAAINMIMQVYHRIATVMTIVRGSLASPEKGPIRDKVLMIRGPNHGIESNMVARSVGDDPREGRS